MRKIISHHQESKAMTRSLFEWIADPASRQCTQLVLRQLRAALPNLTTLEIERQSY